MCRGGIKHMEILICRQGLFGGTDKLLDRLYGWLKGENYSVDICCLSETEMDRLRRCYELVIIPSSQLGNLYELSNRGIRIKRVLMWIMGMGAFSDAYYNYPASSFFDKMLQVLYKKEAEAALKWLLRKRAVVFTDSVGIYNTFQVFHMKCSDTCQENIVPIAINVPSEKLYPSHDNRKSLINISWIGRVSTDFKEIPLRHLLQDLDDWARTQNAEVEFTIVGDGDALERIKKEAENVSYRVNFIQNIPYEKLNKYISENVDLLIAMGTSALDGAKNGCPTVIITPVRAADPEKVHYRWIYDSKGCSLGEYPDIDLKTGQRRVEFGKIMEEFFADANVSDKSFEYAGRFDQEKVFAELMRRELPGEIDREMWVHAKRFQKMKKKKMTMKKILSRIKR
jgi:hypothetical protein